MPVKVRFCAVIYVCVCDFSSALPSTCDGGDKVLEKLDAALDVGGVYDPKSERYDHHQKGFNEVFGHGFDTKLSSAGLVYKVNEETFF